MDLVARTHLKRRLGIKGVSRAHSKINVNVRRVRNGLTAIEKRHVAHIDFPIEMARCARVLV